MCRQSTGFLGLGHVTSQQLLTAPGSSCLQSTNMAFGKVTEETVYTCTGHPLKTDIANILDWMLNQDFTTAYRSILFRCLLPRSGLRGPGAQATAGTCTSPVSPVESTLLCRSGSGL